MSDAVSTLRPSSFRGQDFSNFRRRLAFGASAAAGGF